jgi:hypothetical protein
MGVSGSRSHGDNDNAISGEVAKGLKPTCTMFSERIPFEESGVKRVCIVNELLEILQGDLGRGRGTPQALEEMIKAAGPKTNNAVVILGYVFERHGDVVCQ